jgi:hypothetical protein
MLQTVCGVEALSHSSVYEWFKWFRDWCGDLEDDSRCGRPSISRNADTIANVLGMVICDRRWAPRMKGGELNMSKETIHRILYDDLHKKKKISAKLVPHRLTDEQKRRRLKSWQYSLQTCQETPTFSTALFSFLR